MARYKIATKTDVLRYKIAKEVFGEVEDSDGVRDVPSWEIFEKCLEQNKQIKQLQDQLALTEKAFDLMSLVLCTGARNDLKNQLCKFTWREDVKKFFI